MTPPAAGPSDRHPDPRSDTSWKSYADRLVRAGILTVGTWRDAEHEMPRHHFVPTHSDSPDRSTWHRRRCPRHRARPASLARPRLRPGPAHHRPVRHRHVGPPVPRRRVPRPGLTLRMLHTLDIRATDQILELGTGSGHTTALLAHRVGADQVTTIDPELHHLAHQPLTQLDLHPHQVLADSTMLNASPHPSRHHDDTSNGRFDQVLVGHTVDRIPPGWLTILAPDALVLAVHTGGLGAGHPVTLRYHHAPVQDGDDETRTTS
jgi:protein-L-isoaspartate O-methyltransferase